MFPAGERHRFFHFLSALFSSDYLGVFFLPRQRERKIRRPQGHEKNHRNTKSISRRTLREKKRLNNAIGGDSVNRNSVRSDPCYSQPEHMCLIFFIFLPLTVLLLSDNELLLLHLSSFSKQLFFLSRSRKCLPLSYRVHTQSPPFYNLVIERSQLITFLSECVRTSCST